MVTKNWFSTLVVGLLFCSCEAAAAPAQLYGKSVVVSFTNTIRMRESDTQKPFRTVSFQKQLTIYISTVGRPFLRNSTVTPRASGKLEQVGATGTTLVGGTSTVHFEGRSLVILFAHQNGATRIQADFDAGFASCTAHAIAGKAEGASALRVKRITDGRMIDVQSSSTSGVTCSVKDENALAQ